MLKSIELKDVATYDSAGQKLEKLKQVNFLYGANGSGKTTISRVVQNPSNYPTCSLEWVGPELNCNVYNQDFINTNFHQDVDLKGIFTLGKSSKELVDNIRAAKDKVELITNEITGLTNTLEGTEQRPGKYSQKKEIETAFDEEMWSIKKKYQNTLKESLRGYLAKKPDFSAKVRKAYSLPHRTTDSVEQLIERYNSLFKGELDKISELPYFSSEHLEKLTRNEILNKIIVGKDDVEVARLIKHLSNSDWIKEGIQFLDKSGDSCPFCQQKITSDLKKNLTSYFDEAYTSDINSLKTLYEKYKAEWASIELAFTKISQQNNPFIDSARFTTLCQLAKTRYETNLSLISKKIGEPSKKYELEDLQTYLKDILDLISESNKKTKERNILVENKIEEKRKLSIDVWSYIAEETKDRIQVFKQKISAVENAIQNLEKSIDEKGKNLNEETVNLSNLERQGTSITSSIEDINKILDDFGFKGFKLDISESPGYYRIVRNDGSDAKNSLSEGEKTFITFLYFIHLLRGSLTESDVNSNRVAIIDDPVSSLDSEILFIVSTLIKDIVYTIDIGSIKQIIILTHNMYFFKEVSFISQGYKRDRSKKKLTSSYWVVSKREEKSLIERHETNPVKSAYQMLWDEIKRPENSRHTIRNTIRRILEYYFSTIGDQSLDDLPNSFDGSEKHICRSLISWVHEGSHFTDDDYTVIPSIETVERQLSVFKRIFEVTQHTPHYEMMMGTSLTEQADANLEVQES